MESKITLADDVLAWTFGKPSEANIMLEPRNSNVAVASHMRSIRNRVKSARRFYLDDEFVETALDISRDLDRLQHWVNLARLPYENVWIEFNAQAKVLASWKQGHFQENISDIVPIYSQEGKPDLKDVPEKFGFLITQLDADSGMWASENFAPVAGGKLDKGKITTIPLSWVLSPEGDATLPLKSPLGKEYHQIRQMFGTYNKLLGLHEKGFENAGALGISAFDPVSQQFALLPWMNNRIALCMEPMHLHSLADYLKIHDNEAQNASVTEQLVRHLWYVLKEDRGIMRFLISVLALMNNAPNIKRIPVANPGHRQTRGRNLEYLGHSIVTLDLPKKKTITVLTKALDFASNERRRNRGHEVRGHFRQIERGKAPLAYRCEHVPTLVENGVGICMRCERMIRWIPSHARGDAELGWVTHEYNVVTS